MSPAFRETLLKSERKRISGVISFLLLFALLGLLGGSIFVLGVGYFFGDSAWLFFDTRYSSRGPTLLNGVPQNNSTAPE